MSALITGFDFIYNFVKEKIKRAKIIEMHCYVKNHRGKHTKIAHHIKKTPNYVKRAIKRFNELGTIDDRPKIKGTRK